MSVSPSSNEESEPTRMSHRQVLEVLSGLLLGMFLSMFASTVVSTSLPILVNDLGGNQTAFTWVVTSMLLTTAISTPVWGKFADLMNRKTLFQVALIIFAIATIGAGVSQDIGMHIGFRALQGVGAGGLAALSQIIMADIISPRERGRYMGLFGAVMAVATVGGPLLGGVITDSLNWRWNYLVMLPFVVVTFIILGKTLKLPEKRREAHHIDYAGMVFLAVSVSLLMIWATLGGRDFAWISATSMLMIAGVLVGTAAFIWTEVKSPEPLIPLRLFRDRVFTLAVLASVAIGLSMFGTSVFLGQYMQLARGASPTMAGVMTIPMIAGLLLSSVIVGQLVTKHGHWKPYMVVGAILLVVGTVLLATLHYDTPFGLVSVYMFVLGAGVGMTMQNLVLIVQNDTKPSDMGAATSGVTFFRNLGGTVGVSVMGAVLASQVAANLAARQQEITTQLQQLGESGAALAEQLHSGVVPQVSAMPDGLKLIFEDSYAEAIAHAFMIGVPFAVVCLVAVLMLPNRPLTSMTNLERQQAE